MRNSGMGRLTRLLIPSWRPLGWVLGFSLTVNLLLFSGPLYLLIVYDRVLVTHSAATLLSVTLAVGGACLAYGLLDTARHRLMAEIAARTARTAAARGTADPHAATIGAALSSPAALALVDLPWSLLFLSGLALLHPALGVAGLASLILLVPLQALSGRPGASTPGHGRQALLRALRMAAFSGLVGLGAWLVLAAALSGGAIFAASLLLGRALAPFDVVTAHWPLLQAARAALATMPAPLPPRPSPASAGDGAAAGRTTLRVRDLSIAPPGGATPVMQGVSFDLPPGRILGVAGDVGAGKTALLRALSGDWPVLKGSIHLTPAGTEPQSSPLPTTVAGHLPRPTTRPGDTLAQVIARGSAMPDPAMVLRAARRAGAQGLILTLPDGFRTRLAADGAPLSGGQLARIALAQALYGDPHLLLLDEPDAALDPAGAAQLHRLLQDHRAAGGAAILASKRAATLLCCDDLMILSGGRVAAQGPRDEVLGRIARAPAPPPTYRPVPQDGKRTG